MKRITLLIVFCTVLSFLQCKKLDKRNNPKYLDTSFSFEDRAEDLVSRMTLDEKVAQMLNEAKSIERLGIKEYNWMNECLHGVANMRDYVTVFPQSIGIGASWDTETMLKVSTAISDEARAMHHNGYRSAEGGNIGGLTYWSPNINLFRDPRWGRGQESYGEDPYHIGQMAIPFIKGLQGDNDKYLKLVSTAKHYLVHSGPEPLRHEFDAKASKRDFWETYIPHFLTAVQEAQVYSVMCAYNRYEGESCCGSDYLMNQLLRDQFGFEGYIVSDCGSVRDIYEGHKIVKSSPEAAALAVKSGVDLNCAAAGIWPYKDLQEAVKKGLITEAQIDTAVTRLMLARMKLGMFDDPELVPYSKISSDVIDSQKHKDIALNIAQKSLVLLKNDNNTLPLSKDVKKVAVIGPNAFNETVLLGNYHGIPSNPTSVYTGIKKALPNVEIIYSKGCNYVNDDALKSGLPTTTLFTDKALTSRGLIVEYFNNLEFSGESVVRDIDKKVFLTSEFGIPYKEEGIVSKNFSVRWSGYFESPETTSYQFVAGGVENGTISKINKNYKFFIDDKIIIDGIKGDTSDYVELEAGIPHSFKIELVVDNDEFDFEMYWRVNTGGIEKNSIKAAKEADVVIMTMGISTELEGEELNVKLDGFAGGDRTTIELPKVQQELIKKVKAVGKPVILVLMGGSAFALPEEDKICDAIIQAWYPGQEGGTAVANTIFGDYNPGGKLPLTFYKSTEDLSDYYSYDMENRTYRFFKGEPLYKFGHGLSYTRFGYSNLLIKDSIKLGEPLQISIDVKNTGEIDGDEVVQVYVKDIEASVRVPIQSLQGFKRVHLKAGETRTISFTLKAKQLALLTDDYQWTVESGVFNIAVGGRQPNAREKSNTNIQIKQIEVIE